MHEPIDVTTAADRSDPRGARARLRRVLLWAIVLLYAGSVPWYRTTEAPLTLIWGLPDWVAIALLCYLAAAVLNAVAWWWTEIDDAAPSVVDDWTPGASAPDDSSSTRE